MPLEDQLLVERSKKGDREAFEHLVQLYENKVYTIAYRLMGNHADAADLAQEAFIKIYQALPNFRGDSSFSTWIYHITVNVCRDELRKRQRRPTVSLDEPAADGNNNTYEIRSVAPGPEEMLDRSETQAMIQQCLNALSDDYRTILVMREIQELSYEEIADILGCSLGTVKSRLSRARQALKEKISQQMSFTSPKRMAK
ncbi:RNA polymerase sigma factor [Desulforamulus hydrothermalis]|uniref:RNA polymerase sigma-H factor n=1 Tax=Desulforamulus hydrothermalis Lam5 = DSM 18033 TaxID=1121428 RepID=K8EC83_9FIRM|nr:sigma-70 family RNA polymerase sigma factor [Desulforamulus hydrothermalis]CCO09298.1 RNA polymerase sigma-H factor [Desulforamulus hydrothermalis Lam5 = DSM 18033]SHH04659.1 RNA polymerase, sigma-24 subunit, RpoE [Desulforamulus hydrothermalis Lam5 = DSM 18033]